MEMEIKMNNVKGNQELHSKAKVNENIIHSHHIVELDYTIPTEKVKDLHLKDEFQPIKDMEVSEKPHLDGGYGWIIVMSSLILLTVCDGVSFSYAVPFPIYVQYFNASVEDVSWVGSILNGFIGISGKQVANRLNYKPISGPLAGALCAIYGCRFVCILGSTMGAAGFALSPLCSTIKAMMFCYGMLSGTGSGFMFVASVIIVNNYFDKKRATAVGIATCGSGIGIILFGELTRSQLDVWGWKGCNILFGGLYIQCVLFSAFMRPIEEYVIKLEPLEEHIKDIADIVILAHAKTYVSGRGPSKLEESTDVPKKKKSEEIHFVVLKKVEDLHNESKYDEDKLSESQLKLSKNEETNNHRDPTSANIGSPNSKTIIVSHPSGSPLHMDIHHIPLGVLEDLIDRDKNIIAAVPSEDLLITGQKVKPTPLEEGIFYRGSLESLRKRDEKRPKITKKVREVRKAGFISVIEAMLSFSLLKDKIFLIIIIVNVIFHLGYWIPLTFMVDAAMLHGIDEKIAMFTITIYGISNTIGRIFIGAICDLPKFDTLLVYNIFLVLIGMSTFAYAFVFSNLWGLIFVTILFGFTSASTVTLRPILLVDLIGSDKLINAYGLDCFFYGISTMLATPFGGMIFDRTKNYTHTYYIATFLIFCPAVLSFFIPLIIKRLSSQDIKNEND